MHELDKEFAQENTSTKNSMCWWKRNARHRIIMNYYKTILIVNNNIDNTEHKYNSRTWGNM